MLTYQYLYISVSVSSASVVLGMELCERSLCLFVLSTIHDIARFQFSVFWWWGVYVALWLCACCEMLCWCVTLRYADQLVFLKLAFKHYFIYFFCSTDQNIFFQYWLSYIQLYTCDLMETNGFPLFTCFYHCYYSDLSPMYKSILPFFTIF